MNGYYFLDVVKIWDTVSAYIESYMKQSKVNIIFFTINLLYYSNRALQFQVLVHLLLYINVLMLEIINIY